MKKLFGPTLNQLRLTAGRALVGNQGRLARRPISSRVPGLIQEVLDGLGQGCSVLDHNPGPGFLQDLPGPAEIFEMGAIDGRIGPRRRAPG